MRIWYSQDKVWEGPEIDWLSVCHFIFEQFYVWDEHTHPIKVKSLFVFH